jgi:endonuclease/exonuclease/phosphatase family metal-dependent hydrolase
VRSRLLLLSCIFIFALPFAKAQDLSAGKVTMPPWPPENGDGTYTNPVLYADYSDPDVIRVDDEVFVEPSPRVLQDRSHAALRIMTWNIRYDNPDDGVHAWPKRRDELLSFVAARHVDVLCIQEGLQHQVQFLKDGMTGFDVYGVGRDDGKQKGEYAAIYFRQSRFSCLAHGTFWLSTTPDVSSKGWDAALPRIVSWTRLYDSLARGDVYVFNTHFDHQGVVARENSARLLRTKVREIARTAPFILTGDFNAGEKDSCYRILTARTDSPPYFNDAMFRSLIPHEGPAVSFTGFPFTSVEVRERIDFIFVNDVAEVQRHAILEARREPGYISDHLPVLADIQPR